MGLGVPAADVHHDPLPPARLAQQVPGEEHGVVGAGMSRDSQRVQRSGAPPRRVVHQQ